MSLELDDGNFTVLKVIQIENINKIQYFSGYLSYSRILTKDYDEKTPDFIDQMIFDAISNAYPEARLILNKNILFKGQLDEVLIRFNGKDDIDFKIVFMPYVPFNKINVLSTIEIKRYVKGLRLRYSSLTNKKTNLYITTTVQAEIPFDKITEFNSKIKSIIFK